MKVEDCSIKYVCDAREEQLQKVRDTYPQIETTMNYADLLNDPALDAVLIATPAATHFGLAKQALLAGKHVLVEKPITVDMNDGLELAALAKSCAKVVMVDHTFLFNPAVVKVKELIDRGTIGRVLTITSQRLNLGLFRSDADVVWDLAPHDFSILRYWLGEAPTSVSAFGSRSITPDLVDTAHINLGYQSGINAQVVLSWLSPVKGRLMVVTGTEGMILYDDAQPIDQKVRVTAKAVRSTIDPVKRNQLFSYTQGEETPVELPNTEALYAMAEHFVRCVRTAAVPLSDVSLGLDVVRTMIQVSDKINTTVA